MSRPLGQAPSEHGSWAFLGLRLGAALVVAPSGTGAWLAAAALVAFLARVPLKRTFKARRVLAGDRRILAMEILAGLGAAFLLTIVGVHVLDFMPSDDAPGVADARA